MLSASWQWSQQLFHKFGSPKWFYTLSGRLLPWFSLAFAGLFVVGLVWGLAFAPQDYQQGNSARIMYIHVPTAILSQSCYMLMALAGVVGLVWRIKLSFAMVACCAPIGATLTFAALLTGAIWGKPTWGTYWEWDARLTSVLLMLFLYLGVMALKSAFEQPETGEKAAAVLAIVGAVNIPIIKYSVEWWNTLHQPASFTLTEKPAMPPEMWLPLLVMTLAFYCLFAVALLLRMRNEILLRERKTRWVQEILDA